MARFLVFIPLLVLQTLAYDWHEESTLYWAERCDFSGNDLSSAKTQGEGCGSTCFITSGCTHFTWTRYEGGTCWMKKNGADASKAINSNNNEYSVCGFMKPGGGSFANGQALAALRGGR